MVVDDSWLHRFKLYGARGMQLGKVLPTGIMHCFPNMKNPTRSQVYNNLPLLTFLLSKECISPKEHAEMMKYHITVSPWSHDRVHPSSTWRAKGLEHLSYSTQEGEALVGVLGMRNACVCVWSETS